MYGWIVDGISSLFEPVTGKISKEWPGRGSVSREVSTRPGGQEEAPRQQSHSRPAKRNYQSVDVTGSVCQSEPVEVKRRRRDVVVSFVKKTVAGVAGLLRLRNPLTSKREKPRHYEDPQPVILMGIDELHTSWLNSAEWRMDKPVCGVNDRGVKHPFQSSSAPLVRKLSGTALSTGLPDRGKDRERRGSFQLLSQRSTLRVGASNLDPPCNGLGHSRCHKPHSLTVEEAIKQSNKEHYRRLLEMVTEQYSKTQPLPFNQTKPQDDSLSLSDRKPAASAKTYESVPRKTGYTAAPNVFTWRNAAATKDRWGNLSFSKSYSGSFESTEPARNAKKQVGEVDLSTEVATRLNLVDRETPAAALPDSHTTHSRLSDEDIPKLTKEMAMEVSNAMAQRDPNLVLSSAFKLRITQRDLLTLQEGGWLNDEVMNFYLSLVMERSSGEGAGVRVYSFSTFFYPKLRGGTQPGGHAAVKRWTKSVDLFLYSLILVPLHLGVHWAMAIIDFNSKTVRSYDSMGQRHDDICSLLLLYLKEEHKAKRGRELDTTKWSIGSFRATEIPQQRNGSDCGVFACKYADYIAKGRPLTFKQSQMPLFRKLMIWEILNQNLL